MFFFFNDTATTEIYTLSLHDALPISAIDGSTRALVRVGVFAGWRQARRGASCHAYFFSGLSAGRRSEEHTSELQSRLHLVCRLLLEKKKSHRAATRRRRARDAACSTV